jgi:hypothetical protein
MVRTKTTTVDGALVVASQDAVAAVLYLFVGTFRAVQVHTQIQIVLVLSGALAGQFLFVSGWPG